MAKPIGLQLPGDQLRETAIPNKRRHELYQRAKELQQQDHSIGTITIHLGSSRNTIGKYFKQAHFVPAPDWGKTKSAHLEIIFTSAEARSVIKPCSTKSVLGVITEATWPSFYPAIPIPPQSLPCYQLGISLIIQAASSRDYLASKPSIGRKRTSFFTHLINHNESIGLMHPLSLRFKRIMRDQ